MQSLFLVFDVPLDANLAEGEMVLQPLVLVLVVDEVGEQFPVTGRVLAPLDHEVITIVAKVRHRGHANDSVLDMHQLLEAQMVRSYGYLGVLDLHNGALIRTDQLDGVLVALGHPDEAAGLLRALCHVLVHLPNLVQVLGRGWIQGPTVLRSTKIY